MSPLPSMYVLDTNVLSELARKRPNPTVVDWIRSERAAMSIPFGAVIEIERGIVNLENHDIVRARDLSVWLQSLLVSDAPFLPMDADTARLYARMTTVAALRDLWLPSTVPKTPKPVQDLAIAAVAITKRASVATMNIKDFLRIDRHFPLPGLYNPAMSEWRIRPRGMTAALSLASDSGRPEPPAPIEACNPRALPIGLWGLTAHLRAKAGDLVSTWTRASNRKGSDSIAK